MKWHIICASGMVLVMESSKSSLDFIKFVQDGFQNNLQESRSTAVSQSARAYGTATVTEVLLF
jgi:hypothetical protein